MSLLEQTASELLTSLNDKKISSVELTEAYLNQIESYDHQIGAYLRLDRQSAIEQAKAIDEKRASGQPLGLLGGLPVAVKDILCTKGETTTCASKILENFVPPYDATVIQNLRAADGVILGKTNLDEFAMGGSTENSAYQQTHNPWNTDCAPGGSSGGAAACVAASMAPLSIGTDTGGSIRQPAGLCGVTGMKPTYGRVSRYGLIAFASSLDQIGPLAHTAEDTALLLEAIATHDPKDSTSVNRAAENYSQTVKQPLSNMKIGVVDEHFGPGLNEEVEQSVRQAIETYESLGAEVKRISLPHSKYAIAVYYIISSCEASSNLSRFDGAHYGHRTNEKEMLKELQQQRDELAKNKDTQGLDNLDSPLVRMYRDSRSQGFGPEVKRRIMLGAYALSAGYYDAYYLKALKVRRLIREDFDRAFDEVDMIVSPVSATTAFKLGEKVDDPLAMYLVDLYTVSANLAGICGISIPCGFSSEGLPIGLQLQAAPFEEERLLRAAHMYQTATNWHNRRAELVTS